MDLNSHSIFNFIIVLFMNLGEGKKHLEARLKLNEGITLGVGIDIRTGQAKYQKLDLQSFIHENEILFEEGISSLKLRGSYFI